MNVKSTGKPLKTKTDWERLRQMKDEDIDYSDIPATDEAFWADATIFIPIHHKVHISIRLDDDIIAYFKQQGQGYQSKINAVLRAYMHAQSKKRGKK